MTTDSRETDRALIFEELKAEYVDEFCDLDNEELLEKTKYFQDTHGYDSEISIYLDFFDLTASLREEHRTTLILYCAEHQLQEEF